MSTSLPKSRGSAPRIETTSKVGTYGETLVIGVLGFVLGNLAWDAIKEQIHHDTSQSSSQPAPISPPSLVTQSEPALRAVPQPAPISPPPLAAQSEPIPPAVPQPVSTVPPSLVTQSEPRPLAELLRPQEPFDKQPAQVRPEHPAAPTNSPPPARGPAEPIINPSSAIGDASVHATKGDPSKATTIQFSRKLAEEHYGRGIAYGQKGSYDKAIAELTEAIWLSPKWAQAYYNRGVTYWHRGNHDRAIADFNEAIRLSPKLAGAYYGRGCAYWHYGQKVKAEEDFAQAKRLGYTSPKPKSTSIIQMSLSTLAGAMPVLWP